MRLAEASRYPKIRKADLERIQGVHSLMPTFAYFRRAKLNFFKWNTLYIVTANPDFFSFRLIRERWDVQGRSINVKLRSFTIHLSVVKKI